MDNKEATPTNVDPRYPAPLSFTWRLQHNVAYLIGCITFFIGSFMYYPTMTNYEAGGWLFTVGSIGFLYADLSEWWKNNKVGCAFDAEYREDFEAQVGKDCEPVNTIIGRFQRAENGINFMYSVIGSLLYLIGSILLIPAVGTILEGTIVYIPGGLVVLTSQLWKLYRAGCKHPSGNVKYSDRRFSFHNLCHDWTATQVDLHAAIGGFGYSLGSYMFLPGSGFSATEAAAVLILGGAGCVLSGLFMTYRYFCSNSYPASKTYCT